MTKSKILLEKLVDKFGLYVPFKLLVGGRINISFDANNDEEKKEIHSLLENKIKCEFNAGFKWISSNLNLESNKKNINDNHLIK